MGELKLKDLAQAIEAHLNRFEADPVLSRKKDGKTARFWGTGCGVSGRFVVVTYISYQGSSNLSKSDAISFLPKLEGGYVGRHHEALREPERYRKD